MESKKDLKVIRTPTVFFMKLANNKKAFLAYRVISNVLELVETYTPPEFRGKGIASLMVKEAIKFAKENNLKIRPVCSYAIDYFRKHPEVRDILVPEYRELSVDEWNDIFNKRLEEERNIKKHLGRN